jgi:HAMP domain-containing protein
VALPTSTAAGFWVYYHLFQRLNAITEAALQITQAGDLHRNRIPYTGPNDEVGRLTKAFNATLARLEGSGAIAQGPGAVAAGKGGVAIGGDVHGSVIITGDDNTVNAEPKD